MAPASERQINYESNHRFVGERKIMIACGLNLSRDASVTAFENWRCATCVEIEKSESLAHYSEMEALGPVTSVLHSVGRIFAEGVLYTLGEID